MDDESSPSCKDMLTRWIIETRGSKQFLTGTYCRRTRTQELRRESSEVQSSDFRSSVVYVLYGTYCTLRGQIDDVSKSASRSSNLRTFGAPGWGTCTRQTGPYVRSMLYRSTRTVPIPAISLSALCATVRRTGTYVVSGTSGTFMCYARAYVTLWAAPNGSTL